MTDLTQSVRDAIWTEIRRQADKPRSFSLTATNWVGLDKPGFIDGEVDLDLVARAAVEAMTGKRVHISGGPDKIKSRRYTDDDHQVWADD